MASTAEHPDATEVEPDPTPMSTRVTGDDVAGTGARSLDGGTGMLVAGLIGAAGLIHIAMVPAHAGESTIDGIGFALAAWAQIWLALNIVTGRAHNGTYRLSMAVNVALIGLWIWSRTVGLPFGGHAGIVEPAGLVDGVTVALEGAAVVAAGFMAVLPGHRSNKIAPLIGGVAALALATAVVTSPDATNHAHTTSTASGATNSASAVSADGHSHGGATATGTQLADLALIDSERCDQSFNPKAYWSEAASVGVDTYGGGTLAMPTPAGAGTVAATVAAPDPNGGRGSDNLDRLIALTDLAGGGEGAAAGLIVRLSESTDQQYQDWLTWLKASGATHSHATTSSTGTSGDDSGGHGGHVGPQPWKAMIDASDCDRLEGELKLARETALKYPTVADAEAAGWTKVTGYVPGIAAHYMKFDIVDDKFEIDQPEMILYDGTLPNSRVVGLSYYITHAGSHEPTQGFTGGNDHFHRHVGLCTKAGVVVGDSTLTDAECATRGGVKANGSIGWMSHAWVVPGCESPWGVFSAANPITDRDLSRGSGTGKLGCAASGVANRYDLTPGTKTSTADATEVASGG